MAPQTSIVTKDLTKSFRWEAGQGSEQQDVQEFCRVLFDAIDSSFNLVIGGQEEPKENSITLENFF